ncbi:MAG: D-tyrosyl-tRNA(Tyr) deacylase [Gammaproteobacteria bacterium]|nr:D-tyrosyl-tRNA(Tyr) deacylase [Gammaproteobacteria bacterium]TVQ43393.1 MAG: D-tyrosyl-tRNA(Tyr) deacylase [Gammaproteobacteria bacterium]
MIALLQRVSEARVDIAGNTVAAIDRGLLVLVGVERADREAESRRLAERLVAYRLFPDDAGRMNLDVRQAAGSLLLVPQFTLAADTDRGNRPSFTRAAEPAQGETLFNALAQAVHALYPRVASGIFGANMQVWLCNDGPVTFRLQVTDA